MVVDQSQIVRLPREMPLDAASLLACGVITGFGAVTNTAKMPAGSSVAVIGTGGVGLNSVQGARLSGASPIIALDLSDEKLEAAKAFGAAHTVNAGREDAVTAVKGLTHERGVDYAFVTVGSINAIEQGLALLRRGGTVVLSASPRSARPPPWRCSSSPTTAYECSAARWVRLDCGSTCRSWWTTTNRVGSSSTS